MISDICIFVLHVYCALSIHKKKNTNLTKILQIKLFFVVKSVVPRSDYRPLQVNDNRNGNQSSNLSAAVVNL